MLDILLYSLKNVSLKKSRCILTILGISIGVMSVVIISTIGKIGTTTIKNELKNMGIGGVVLTTDVMSNKNFSLSDIDNIKKLDEIKNASPFMTKYTDVKAKGKSNSCMIWGIDEQSDKIINMKTLHGRRINKSDVSSKNNVCLVDESFAIEHYKRSNIVNKNIDIFVNNSYKTYKIVGVIKSGGNIMQNFVGSVVPSFIYIPYTTMDINNENYGFDQIVAQTKENTDIDALSKQVMADFKQNRGFKVNVSNLNSQMDNLNNVLNIITMVLTVIAGISLIVAGLSIMTVMLVSVKERTVEIGIKKAIGANKKIIITEFITESLCISFLGAIFGIFFGVLISVIGCIILSIDVIINTKMIAFSLFFALFIGTLFGIYPAIKASNLRPVDAIRS